MVLFYILVGFVKPYSPDFFMSRNFVVKHTDIMVSQFFQLIPRDYLDTNTQKSFLEPTHSLASRGVIN